jgi:hypothetical protein
MEAGIGEEERDGDWGGDEERIGLGRRRLIGESVSSI